MRRLIAALILTALAPAAGAQTIADTDCDRLAGFWLMPRFDGAGQVYAITDAYAAARACDAARNAHPAETFFNLLLARALLVTGQDPLRTLPLVQGALDQWPGLAHWQLGALHDFGESGLTPSETEAFRQYEQGCAAAPALGAQAACTQAALMQVEGRGTDPDPQGGLDRLQGLCDAGWAPACTERMLVGEIYAADTPEDQVALLETGCLGSDLYACSLLGLRHEQGFGAPFDAARARELYTLSCDGGDSHGCANLGETYRAGIGVAPDMARAVTLFRRACDGLDAYACATLGHILNNAQGVPRDPGRALVAFETACTLGDPEACDMADQLR